MTNTTIKLPQLQRKIPCRCISKTYREWSSCHNKKYPFKHNNNLNKRWDVRNHPFYENVIRGNGIHDMNFSMASNSVDVNESFKQDLLEGKYDQM